MGDPPIELLPWQTQMLRDIRNTITRKNGKSRFASWALKHRKRKQKQMNDHLAEALSKLNPGDNLKISLQMIPAADDRLYWVTLRSNHGLPTSAAQIDDKLADACGGAMAGALSATIEKLIAIRRREMEAKTDLHNSDQTCDD